MKRALGLFGISLMLLLSSCSATYKKILTGCKDGEFVKKFPEPASCMACDAYCAEGECRDGDGCNKCKPGYYTVRKDSYWPKRCVLCKLEGCAECSDGAFEAHSKTCAKCEDGYELDADTKLCVKQAVPSPSGVAVVSASVSVTSSSPSSSVDTVVVEKKEEKAVVEKASPGPTPVYYPEPSVDRVVAEKKEEKSTEVKKTPGPTPVYYPESSVDHAVVEKEEAEKENKPSRKSKIFVIKKVVTDTPVVVLSSQSSTVPAQEDVSSSPAVATASVEKKEEKSTEVKKTPAPTPVYYPESSVDAVVAEKKEEESTEVKKTPGPTPVYYPEASVDAVVAEKKEEKSTEVKKTPAPTPVYYPEHSVDVAEAEKKEVKSTEVKKTPAPTPVYYPESSVDHAVVEKKEKKAVVVVAKSSLKTADSHRKDCAAGTFFNAKSCECEDCDPYCSPEKCVDDKGCAHCQPGYYLYRKETISPAKCLKCNIAYCSVCTTGPVSLLPVECAKCDDGYELSDDKKQCNKVASAVINKSLLCKPGQFFKTMDQKCVDCDKYCLPTYCEDKKGCMKCQPGYYASRGDPFWDRRCKSCDIKNCDECKNDVFDHWKKKCVKCKAGYILCHGDTACKADDQ